MEEEPQEMEGTRTPAPPALAAPEDDMGFKVGGGAGDGGQGRLRRRPRRRSMDDEEEYEDEEVGRTSRRWNRRPPWQSLFEVSAGLILLKRTFNFNEPVQPQDPADYRTPGVVPAIHLEGAVYPFPALMRGFATGFGLAMRYYRVLGLKSRVDGATTLADTVVQEFEIGLRYRWNVLSKASSPVLRFGLDYGSMSFTIEDPQIALPNISYSYLKLAAVGVDVPIYVARRFAFGALGSFDYLLVFSAGDIERNEAGGYGDSSTGGIDIGLGLFASYSGFFARALGFYRRFFYAFDGNCWRLRVNACNYAGGALDIYVGGAVNVGYAY